MGGPLAAANAARHEQAGRRDAAIAAAIIADPGLWALLDATQRRITEARAACPRSTWAEIGARLRIGKNAAFATWRRLLDYPALTRLKETTAPNGT